MPRSSRHKSHRSHKHGGGDGRERSDSEDDGNSQKPEPAARVSRDTDADKRKSSMQNPQAKDLVSGNGDFSGEHGRKRKDRSAAAMADESVVVVVDDRWNGGGDDDHVIVDKKAKAEVFSEVGDPDKGDKVDKAAKSKLSAGDSKSRSSRRHEGSSDRVQESGSKVESVKPRSEKELSRRESSGSQHKIVKERERDYSKGAKERDRDYGKDARERDRDYVKDAKEKEREHVKDVKEKDRDQTKELKERDRGHSKDGKDRDGGHSKDGKERDIDHIKDAKERGRDHPKETKERDRDYSKDAKERDAKEGDEKERVRDHYKDAKERDRDYYKEDRDRDFYKDAKERDRDNYKDAKERDRDYCRDIKERDRDYPKDAKEKERDCGKDTKDRDRDSSKDTRERDRDYYKDARERDYTKDVRERERDYAKDVRERDRERGSERDRRVHDAVSKKQSSKTNSAEGELDPKKNVENSGGQIQDGLCNPEPEKELDKHVRRRDSSGNKDKYLGDVKDSDDRRLSSRDDHTKNSSYKDESQREGRYRDRYKDDVDRDQRHRDDRGRDERSSRDHNNRSDNKHFRDENRLPESRYKKSKIQDPDHDSSPYVDDHGTKLRDNRGRKIFSDENEDHFDLKPPRGAKETHEDLDKNASNTSKFDPHTDKARLDYLHADKVDSGLGSRPKSSPSSGNHNMKDTIRSSSKQVGSSCRKSMSEEKVRLSTASRDHVTLSGVHERDSESRSSEKNKTKEGGRLGEVEPVTAYYDKTSKSDVRASPNLLKEKSSTANDWRFSDKIGSRRSFDVEVQRTGSNSSSRYGRDNSNPKDRERGLPFDKSIPNDHLRGELHDSETIPTGLSSFNRSNHLPGSSPSYLPPPPSVGHGIGSPSVLGSFEDDNRGQIGDRKPNSRYKRSAEHGMGRGQGNAWKSASSWPSPVANGYMHHLQHVPPPGFHPAVQQFPTPLYGVRPSMELNHPGVSYHLHEPADRFSSHGRPFGWHNPVDDCPPPMQVWDGRNGIFGDESHVYGRPEWDMNRQLMNNRGWEMNADMWKGQNGKMNIELPVPQESEYSACSEAWAGQTGPQSRKERVTSEHLPDDNSEVKHSSDKSLAKDAVETLQRSLREKTPESSKTTAPQTKTTNESSNVHLCRNYLSKLDISLDLVKPELYEECMTVLGMRDKASVHINVSIKEKSQNNKEDPIVAAQNTSYILSSLFTSRTDAVFQRAMSLYKKYNSGVKAMSSLSPSSCAEEKGSAELSDTDEPRGVDKQTISADTLLGEKIKEADNHDSSGTSLAAADSTSSMEEGKALAVDPERSHPSDVKEQQTDGITDAVHFVEASQPCEAIMADCRVNLNRIHLSPGSTH